MLKMYQSIWVNCPVRLQFYISFTLFMLLKRNKQNSFSSDSQPGYVLRMILKEWLISAWTVL